MGMSLCGKEGDTYFNIFSWSHILKLAYWYGWKPKGTEAPEDMPGLGHRLDPDDPDWNGSYFSNGGQFVTDRDANSIAAALERALDDIPDHDTMEDMQTAQDASPMEWFSGQGERTVRDFIEFSRTGGFCIF